MQVLLLNEPISFQSYEFLMPMEYTPLVRTGRFYEMYLFIFFLHLVNTQFTCPKYFTFSLKVGRYCPTHPPDNKSKNVLQMPQQVSIFSYISPGSLFGKVDGK